MNASRDENNVPTLLGALESDGETIIRVQANPDSHALTTNDASTGSDFGPANAPRDENGVPVLMAVSEVDGVTPVVIYADALGQLLIDSN